MNTGRLSCIYYPTTIVLIDDNESFLQKMQQNISQYTPCVGYSNPEEALKAIQGKIKKHHTLENVIDIDTDSVYYSHASGQLPVQYNIANLYKHAYRKDHFSEISVVVLDYEMPVMTGEYLCIKLMNIPIKVIMLTGAADEEVAVKLFNAHLIDKFISKTDPNFDVLLQDSIVEMQNRYFQDLSYPILKGLAVNVDSSLSDPAFIDLFYTAYYDLAVTSYYLIDLSGSFLFLNDAGVPTWLIVKTQDELEEIITQLGDIASHPSWFESMVNGNGIPYFPNLEDYFNPQKLYSDKYWYKANILIGQKKYSYSIIKNLNDFPLDRDKIFSFNKYLNNLPQACN